MPKSNTTRTIRAAKKNKVEVGQVFLAAGKMAKLIVDRYSSRADEPKFTIALEPDKPDMIGVAQERLYEDGVVTCIYHFQNFSDHEYRVTILTQEAP